jgi:hypothetical protein
VSLFLKNSSALLHSRKTNESRDDLALMRDWLGVPQAGDLFDTERWSLPPNGSTVPESRHS